MTASDENPSGGPGRHREGARSPATDSQPLSGTQRLHDARVDRQVRLALDLATVRAERDRARDLAALLEAELALMTRLRDVAVQGWQDEVAAHDERGLS